MSTATSAKAMFNEALQRVNQGQLDAAAAMCRDAIALWIACRCE